MQALGLHIAIFKKKLLSDAMSFQMAKLFGFSISLAVFFSQGRVSIRNVKIMKFGLQDPRPKIGDVP